MRKNILIISIICLFAITLNYTYSAFKKTIKGTITATTNNWRFSVSVTGGVKEKDYYKILLSNSSGSFNISLDTTGSNKNVEYSIEFSGIDNINLYTDSNHTNKINNNIYEGIINKNTTNTLTIYYNSSSTINGYLYIKTKGKVKPISVYEYISNLQNNGVDTNINFANESSATNGEGINIVSGTENNTYPVYYYRGNVTNNNIIYAEFCWRIVRTTETGGVKLVYNGVPSSGKCSSASSFISDSVRFHETGLSSTLIGVGYMYGLNNYSLTQFSEYKNHLEDTSLISSTNTETETIGTKTFNIAGRHTQNAKSSNIKIVIDKWYQNNILNTEYENMLEDTIWCNDRSTSSGEYSLENAIAGNTAFYYSAYDRVESHNEKPTLTCVRNVDKFTVDSKNGNGDLEYPIALLTADEVAMTGNVSFGSDKFWLMTPNVAISPISITSLSGIWIYSSDLIMGGHNRNTSSNPVCPAVSLSNNVLYSSGDGTIDNPIQIKEN